MENEIPKKLKEILLKAIANAKANGELPDEIEVGAIMEGHKEHGSDEHMMIHDLMKVIKTSEERIKNLEAGLQKVQRYLEMPSECKDYDGKIIRAGDSLVTMDGSLKKVLKIGVDEVLLSIGDSTKEDGWWNVREIKERKWTIK